MYDDLDILESTIFDIDDDDDNIAVENSDNDEEYTTEGVVEVTKVLAAIAATLALGALLLVVIRKIKKKGEGKSKEKPAQLESPERKMVNQMEDGIKTNMSNLKSLRDKYKKEMKGADKQTKKQIRAIIKEINSSIREMKGFAKKVAKIAKKASIPIDKIDKLSEQIQTSIKYQSFDNPNFSKESTSNPDDNEYDEQFNSFFESVVNVSEKIYEENSKTKEDEFDFSLDDILG